MTNRVHLDPMIHRADFAEVDEEARTDLFDKFPITYLDSTSPQRALIRKPDFQRETNHWTPAQVASFIASFVDNELIPSLILWKSKKHIFVIDGGHRISALRAWMEDDYGDGPISNTFYGPDLTQDQRKTAKRTRQLVESEVGKYEVLKKIALAAGTGDEKQAARATRLFTRALQVQWVQGSPAVAESSFFKINSQGTPLDDTEEMLLRNRRRPFSVGARAIVRAGAGHKYWSSFPLENQRDIEKSASELYELLFQPEVDTPIRTLDLPLGGAASPVDALGLLVDFLLACDVPRPTPPPPASAIGKRGRPATKRDPSAKPGGPLPLTA